MSDRPHRLPGFSYVGFRRYSLTFCLRDRVRVFTESPIVDEAREQISRAAIDRQFAIPAYCFMPDHLHVLAEAQSAASDLVEFARRLKQFTGYAYCRHRGVRLWQKGYFEHVVRNEETTPTIAKYILENPVRAGLTKEPLEYPFSGSFVFSREQLLDFWHESAP